MTKLTEEIVFQRLRGCSSYLDSITKINITGRDLDDISLLRKMTSIEVLSLSVNKISSLSDFQYCKFLKELYLRKNNISDINEIYYLMDLPALTVLGLSQNPCSNDPNYRMTVIKNLVKLERLDDLPIVAEERIEAFKKGIKVTNPEEFVKENDQIMGMIKFPAEKRASCDEVISLIPGEAKIDEDRSMDLVMIGHRSSALRIQPKTVSQCLRMETSLPEKVHHENVIAERLKPSGGMGQSNLLPGILVLVTDLDYSSLEILSLNIKNRLNEYQMNAFAASKQ